MQSLEMLIPMGVPVVLSASPGVGKTQVVQQAHRAMGRELLISHPVTKNPVDYGGFPFPDFEKGVADFLPYGDLRAMLEATVPLTVFFDDLGQSPAMVQAAIMQLWEAREINGQRISDHVSFVGATNRRGDKAGVSSILEPLKGRAVLLDFDVNLGDWSQWYVTQPVATHPREILAYCRWRGESRGQSVISDFQPTQDMTNSVTPRNVERAARVWAQSKRHGTPFSYTATFELLRGCCGEAWARDCLAFVELISQLATIDQIVIDPHGAPIPSDAAAKFAQAANCGGFLNHQNAGALLTYLDRFEEREFQVVAVKDAQRRDGTLATTCGAITDWMVKNSDLFGS